MKLINGISIYFEYEVRSILLFYLYTSDLINTRADTWNNDEETDTVAYAKQYIYVFLFIWLLYPQTAKNIGNWIPVVIQDD